MSILTSEKQMSRNSLLESNTIIEKVPYWADLLAKYNEYRSGTSRNVAVEELCSALSEARDRLMEARTYLVEAETLLSYREREISELTRKLAEVAEDHQLALIENEHDKSLIRGLCAFLTHERES